MLPRLRSRKSGKHSGHGERNDKSSGARETSGALFSSGSALCRNRFRAVGLGRNGPDRHRKNYGRKATRQRIGLGDLFLRPNSQNAGRGSANKTNSGKAPRRSLFAANDSTDLQETR